MKNYNFLIISGILVIIVIITFANYLGEIIENILPIVIKNLPSLLMWGCICFLVMYSLAKYINARKKRYKNKLTLNLKNSKPTNGEKLNGNGSLDLSKIQIEKKLADGLTSGTHEWRILQQVRVSEKKVKREYTVLIFPKKQKKDTWIREITQKEVEKLLSEGKIKNSSFVKEVLEKL